MLDCNPETLEKAVSKVKKKENVHTICIDVAGLTEAQITAFQKACEEGSSELEKWKEAYDLRVREIRDSGNCRKYWNHMRTESLTGLFAWAFTVRCICR